VAKLDVSPLHSRLSHRSAGGAAALGGTAGIEDPEAVALLVQRHVGVAEDDDVGLGEPGSQALQAALRRACVVDHTQNYVLELERDLLGQLAAKLRTVDVAVNGGDGSQLTQVHEHGWSAEVSRVDDQVRRQQGVQTWIGKTAVAAREMCIRDQSESDQL
jgi:hypothetical protein